MENVIRIISEHLNIPINEITIDSKIVDDLGADSLDIVELTAQFEEIFGCEIADEDIMSIKTVSDICDYLSARSIDH